MSPFNIEAIDSNQIASEIRTDDEGRGFFSIRAVARLFGIDDAALGRNLNSAGGLTPSKMAIYLLKRLSNQGFEGAVVSNWVVTGIPKIAVIAIGEYYSFHAGAYCKESAYKSLCELQKKEYVPRKINLIGKEKQYRKKTSKSNMVELYYQLKLSKELKGKIEVPTPIGRIDILTEQFIIEVKRVSGWKEALGQVLAYGYYYPNHQKRIHLFGEISIDFLKTITDICSIHSVLITTVENVKYLESK